MIVRTIIYVSIYLSYTKSPLDFLQTLPSHHVAAYKRSQAATWHSNKLEKILRKKQNIYLSIYLLYNKSPLDFLQTLPSHHVASYERS